jgi:hypothetical protein
LRDRDAIYGPAFRRRGAGMGIGEVIPSPLSPWQNPYAERLIGSIRRECLDHVIVIGERHVRRILISYIAYYHGTRTHLSLEKDAPTPRRVHADEGSPAAGGVSNARSTALVGSAIIYATTWARKSVKHDRRNSGDGQALSTL